MLELDTNLNPTKKYPVKNITPISIDANLDHLVVAYSNGSIVVFDKTQNDKAKLFWDVVVSGDRILAISLQVT